MLLGKGLPASAPRVKEVIICDSKGIIYRGRKDLDVDKAELAEMTNPKNKKGLLVDALRGMDAFIGVSIANQVSEEMVRSMAAKAIVLAMANPTPEIMPDIAKQGWALVVGRRRPTTTAQRPLLFIIASFLIATLMITPLSRPLWDHLPLLPFTQFPWRFLSVQALFAALLTGGLVTGQGSIPSPRGRGLGRGSSPPLPRSPAPLLSVAASLILLASALLGLRTDHLILTDADVTAERLAQYEWFTGNIGTTISA